MSSFNSPFTGNVIQPTDVSYREFTIAADTPLSWPINGNPDGDYAARIMEATANAGSLSLLMPPANQTSVGTDALIRNVGANTFTVKDYDGGAIVTVAAGEAKYIYVTDNPDEAGTWGLVSFGVGSSSVDAAALAGYGLLASSGTLNLKMDVSTTSNDYTLVTTDRAKSYVWTGGAGTFSLTAATTLANNWYAYVRNEGSGTLILDTLAADLINGSASITLQPGDSCIVSCSGSAFYTIGLGKTVNFNFTQNTRAVVSGAYTLTSVEAQSVIQKFTGTLSGNVTVTVPPTVQVYYIINATDGTVNDYTITFTTGVMGGADAIVGAGEQAIIICDSVDLLNAATVAAGSGTFSIADGSAGTPGLGFASEPSTGMYRAGAGQFNISVLGNGVFEVNASGISVTGTGIFSGGVSGGSF